MQNTPLSWDDAGQECQQLHPNAHLVVINDAAEQSAIESLIKADRSKCPLSLLISRFKAITVARSKATWIIWVRSMRRVDSGTDVGLSPGDFVLDDGPVPLPKKGAESPKFSGV